LNVKSLYEESTDYMSGLYVS